MAPDWREVARHPLTVGSAGMVGTNYVFKFADYLESIGWQGADTIRQAGCFVGVFSAAVVASGGKKIYDSLTTEEAYQDGEIRLHDRVNRANAKRDYRRARRDTEDALEDIRRNP